MSKKIRVLVVDDSAVIRNMLSAILNSDNDIEVIGTAVDPYAARRKLLEHQPDVMTLDVEMPRMDGISFLRRVMTYMPTPTIIISSLTTKDSETTLRALESGALSIVAKPVVNGVQDLAAVAKEIITHVKAAARSNIRNLKPSISQRQTIKQAPTQTSALAQTTHQVIAIASSTGGTVALQVLLSQLPPDIPGTVIVQHMPPGFTTAFASRLNEMFQFDVVEAQDGDRVIPGRVLIAPGNFHMEMLRSGAFYYIKLNQNPPVNSVRPAADVLMKSVAHCAGKNAIGIILTGMGKDGAQGLNDMYNSGSYTIAQDEQSSVVFGMPKAAIDLGCVHSTLPLQDIGRHLLKVVSERSVA